MMDTQNWKLMQRSAEYFSSRIKEEQWEIIVLDPKCLYSNIFEKKIKEETTRGVWDTLKNLCGDNEKLNKVKLKSLRKQHYNTLMNDGEAVA